MARILIAYSTVDGHTRKICERLQRIIADNGHEVVLDEIDGAHGIDVAPFDKIVIGASIRYGKHRPAVFELIRDNRAALDAMPCAFFSVNVVARKPHKNQPDTNPYLQKFLRKAGWQPTALAVFAGKIDYPRYTFFDRQAIRFIMWMTKGPTQPDAVVEFTDWDKVDEFGRLVAEL